MAIINYDGESPPPKGETITPEDNPHGEVVKKKVDGIAFTLTAFSWIVLLAACYFAYQLFPTRAPDAKVTALSYAAFGFVQFIFLQGFARIIYHLAAIRESLSK